MKVITFNAEWDKHGKAAGHVRNSKMLNESPDIVISFHHDLNISKGTRNCVEQAEKLGIPVRRIGNKYEMP